MSRERLFSVSEISKHNQSEDIWIVVSGYVYNVTTFASQHPGGPESMLNPFHIRLDTDC
jgi:cytochrome b involved in lipid metabolism